MLQSDTDIREFQMQEQHQIQLQEAELTDVPSLLHLYSQLGQDDGRVLSVTQAERIFLLMTAYPDYRIYVAKYRDLTVGCFALLVMDNIAHLGACSAIVEDVVVEVSWRGRGVGKLMMAFARQLAEEKGCYKMVLSSNRHREAAHRFYEKLGFVRHGYSFSINCLPVKEISHDRRSSYLSHQ